jgi:hypothetical protein
MFHGHLLVDLNRSVYHLFKSVKRFKLLMEYLYENSPTAPQNWVWKSFEVFTFLHLLSWIDWYTASKNRSNSSTVIQQGVLDGNPTGCCFWRKVWIWPLKWSYSLLFTIAHYVSSRDANYEPSRVMWCFFSAEIAYARKRLCRLYIKMTGFGDNSPKGWDVSMRPPYAHPWPKPRRLMYNMSDLNARGRMCACPTSTGKTPPVDNFTHMGSRDPSADHYEV